MERNGRLYSNADRITSDQIVWCSHMHRTTDRAFHKFVNEGPKFAAFANYYPLALLYPLKDMRENTFKCRQTGCTINNKYSDKEIEKRKSG